MIEWLKNWTNSIIVAIIISVILGLIIPNGNNKKYIKMLINLYVLFIILNPLISKFAKNSRFEINSKNYEKYFENSNVVAINTNIDSNKIIDQTAEKTLKTNIKKKLREYGYNVTSISISIDSENGQINSIKCVEVEALGDLPDNKSDNVVISINQVEKINISNKTTNIEKESLKNSDIKKIKKFLSEEYGIAQENIEIN